MGFAVQVREYVRALVTADRDAMVDPALIEAVAREKLQLSDEWLSVARAYIADHAWPLDGGLAPADVEATLDFFQTHSQLDRQLTAEAVVDITFLTQALKPHEVISPRPLARDRVERRDSVRRKKHVRHVRARTS
jgi:hypothetical protein